MINPSSREHFEHCSQTSWIKGFPAMRWRGLPGKRVDPQRAGRIPMIDGALEPIKTCSAAKLGVRSGAGQGEQAAGAKFQVKSSKGQGAESSK
jgi:hypothetical protein